jgi:hypothetical protein
MRNPRILRAASIAAALAGALALPPAVRAAEPPEPVALVPGANGVALAEGSLEPLDVDAYAVSLGAGDLLFAALFDETGGAFLDTRLGLFQGALLVQDDDGGRGLLSRLAFAATSGGSYELRVSGFRDEAYAGAHAEGAGTAAPYRLVVGVTSALPVESEVNDAAGQEDALPAGGGLVRGTLAALDVDRFSLALPPGAGVAGSLFQLDRGTGAPLPGGGSFDDTRLGLFAGGASPFAEDDDGGPGFFSNLQRTPAGSPSAVQIAVTGFRDAGYAGAHPEGPFDYVLVAAATAPPAERCDVVAPIGQIDRRDIDAIFAARGTAATGPDDPRDADGDGTITVLDGSQCRLQCDYARCATAPPACGLLGVEALLALVPLARRARRRAAAPEVRP